MAGFDLLLVFFYIWQLNSFLFDRKHFNHCFKGIGISPLFRKVADTGSIDHGTPKIGTPPAGGSDAQKFCN